MRPLVVIAGANAASLNIKSALLGLEKFELKEERFWSAADFDMAEYPGSIVEIVPSHDAECYIFASTHKSASNARSLTVHTPGNWGDADLGGQPRTLNVTCPNRLKAAAQKMHELVGQLPGWQVSVEVDHHGPSLSRPVRFTEIGSTEEEWKNPVAGSIVAQAIVAATRNGKAWPCYAGFGGTHYAPKFTPKILNGEIAMGHLISGYALERYGMDGGRIMQAMGKNDGKIESALIDWKGIKGGSRRQLVGLLDQMGIKWEKA